MADEDDAVFTSRLMAFYLSDMSAEIRRFCTARCEPFVEAEEHKLEYTEVFHEFEALVESLLARFVAHEYSTAEGAACEAVAHRLGAESTRLDNARAFYARLERLVKGAEDANAAAALALILSASDYATFVRMMREQNGRSGTSYAMLKTAHKRTRDDG